MNETLWEIEKKINAKRQEEKVREVVRETTDCGVMTVKKVEHHFEKSKGINNSK